MYGYVHIGLLLEHLVYMMIYTNFIYMFMYVYVWICAYRPAS